VYPYMISLVNELDQCGFQIVNLLLWVGMSLYFPQRLSLWGDSVRSPQQNFEKPHTHTHTHTKTTQQKWKGSQINHTHTYITPGGRRTAGMKKSTSKSKVTIESDDDSEYADGTPRPFSNASRASPSFDSSSVHEQLPIKVQNLLTLLSIPFGGQFGVDKDVDPTQGLLLFAIEVISALRDVVRLYKQRDSMCAKSVGSRLVAALTGEIGKFVIYSLTNDWGEEVELAKTFHTIGKRILKLFPEMTTRKHKVSGKMLIHHTCLKAHSKLSMDYIDTLLEICPNSVSSADAHGALPLHWCLRNRHPDLDVMRLLIEKYPKGPLTRDSKGFIPLHWAVHQPSPNLEVITELLRLCPEGAREPCGSGGLPLHWAVNHDTPNLHIVMALEEYYPEAVRTYCKEGWIPLHRAVDRSNPNIDVVAFLIEKYPGGLHHPCRL
jgi:ankyrin repeat protein